MIGTGTQIDPFRPANWDEFVEAVGVRSAYVECPSETWDMREILPDGLTEVLTIAAKVVNGNGLALKRLSFNGGCIDLDAKEITQDITKLYFYDFDNTDNQKLPLFRHRFGIYQITYYDFCHTYFRNCKFTGIVDLDFSGVTADRYPSFLYGFDASNVDNLLKFTDDGEKGCYFDIVFRNGSFVNLDSGDMIQFKNCNIELVNGSMPDTLSKMERCRISGSVKNLYVTANGDNCVYDIFTPEGGSLSGRLETEFNENQYLSIVNSSKIGGKFSISDFGYRKYANLKNPSQLATAISAAAPIGENKYKLVISFGTTAANSYYYYPDADKNKISDYEYSTWFFPCPISKGTLSFQTVQGSGIYHYIYTVKGYDAINGTEQVLASDIESERESPQAVKIDTVVEIPEKIKFLKIVAKDKYGSVLSRINCPASFILIFDGELHPDTWRVSPFINGGDAYHEMLPDLKINKPPEIYSPEYVTVYDRLSTVETFDTHGLVVLSPTKCEITEEYQGKWTLVIEHPRDADRKHEFIKPFNIVKAMGQLFSIVSVSDKIPGLITAKAEHIFYHLNDRWIFPGSRIISASVAGLMLSAKLASSDYSTDDQVSYDFDFTSDIANSDLGVKSNAKWGYTRDGMSLAEFVLGSGNLLEMSGGELYRDNFHYSIFERMENSSDNAFEIRVGKDLTGITRTVDISQMCTYFRAYNGLDNSLGTWFAISYTDAVAGSVAPHSVIRSKIFNPQLPFWIKDEDEIAEMSDALVADEAMRFFKENCKPIVKYEVDIEDVNKNPDFSELKNLPDYRVGNIGTIYDERLGVQASLKITKTIKNAITGKTISVVFGELVGETEIIERTEALRTADMEVLATADGETLYTKK